MRVAPTYHSDSANFGAASVMSTPCAVSIVAPCYNEGQNIALLCERLAAAARSCVGDDFEIILVNDGSKDDTWNAIQREAEKLTEVRGVSLSRNFGHQIALTAGLEAATGDRILMIDADLQDPPELLPEMMAALDAGADVAYGKRRVRRGESAFKLFTADVFYRMLRAVSDVDIPTNAGDFRLISRRALDSFLQLQEKQRYIRGMIAWVGYQQTPVFYDRDPRHAGRTNYSLKKMVSLALDALTAFSTAPLRLAAFFAVLAFLAAGVSVGYVIFSAIAFSTVPGWTSILVAISFFSGAQLLTLAVFGEYLARLYGEAKDRPLYFVSDRAGRQAVQSTDWDQVRRALGDVSSAGANTPMHRRADGKPIGNDIRPNITARAGADWRSLR